MKFIVGKYNKRFNSEVSNEIKMTYRETYQPADSTFITVILILRNLKMRIMLF